MKKKTEAPAKVVTSPAATGVQKSPKKVRLPKAKTGKGGKSPKALITKSPGGTEKGGAREKDASKWKAGDWACAKCGAHNFRGKDACFRCKYAKANSVKAASAESAWDYLTKFAVDAGDGDWDMDSVQHLWLAKHVYGKEVNDACFDLYIPYVESLDNKTKLRLLEGAKLAAVRASQMIDALKDTPQEKAEKEVADKKEKEKKAEKGKSKGKGKEENKGDARGEKENKGEANDQGNGSKETKKRKKDGDKEDNAAKKAKKSKK